MTTRERIAMLDRFQLINDLLVESYDTRRLSYDAIFCPSVRGGGTMTVKISVRELFRP